MKLKLSLNALRMLLFEGAEGEEGLVLWKSHDS